MNLCSSYDSLGFISGWRGRGTPEGPASEKSHPQLKLEGLWPTLCLGLRGEAAAESKVGIRHIRSYHQYKCEVNG